ncbi:MAG: hypothetical protein JST00_25095 [Deltaproteobacteria bacterium]|nr:hypothetical protein [Deltaproteobacteria bacterium]
MKRSFGIVLGACLPILLVACNAQVEPGGGGGGAGGKDRGGEPSPSPSPNVPAPDDEAPGAPACTTSTTHLSTACAEPRMRAGAPLKIAALDDGCWGACEGFTVTRTCDVRVEGTTIRLGLVTKSCGAPRTDVQCTTICMNARVECDLPELAAGTYRVVTVDPGYEGVERLDQLLTVEDGAGPTECLAAPAAKPGG